MVVRNFNLVSVVVPPNEADLGLIVDPDAALSRAAAVQLLKMVSRRNFQVVQSQCRIKHRQFSSCHTGWWRAFGPAGHPYLRRFPVGETLDHMAYNNGTR